MPQEGDVDVCGNVGYRQAYKAQDAVLVDKDVHQVPSEVRRCLKQLEESTIVSLRKGVSHGQRMLHRLALLFIRS